MPKLNVTVVRGAMLRKRMKRADLAGQTGIDPRHLTNSLLARNPLPMDATKIYAICDALGLKYEDVVDADPRPTPDASEAAPAADEPAAVSPEVAA